MSENIWCVLIDTDVFIFLFWQVIPWLEWKELEKPNDQSINTFFFNSEYCWGKTNDPANTSNIADLIIKSIYGCYSEMEVRQALN